MDREGRYSGFYKRGKRTSIFLIDAHIVYYLGRKTNFIT